MDDVTYMRAALDEAGRAAAAGEVPVGAVVVLDGRVIGRGHNRPIEARDATAHAEVEAIRAACREVGDYRLPGTVLYVTVEPCLMCVGAAVHARMARIVYGAPEPKAGAVVSAFRALEHPTLNHRPEVAAGVLADECREVMQAFFRERRERQPAG